jgi:hypothetical protein
MTRSCYLLGATAGLALTLGACAGGGGTEIGAAGPPPVPAATPTPTPTSTPTPTPAGSPAIFSSVTTSTQLAVLGYEGSSTNAAPAALVGTGFSVKYDAATGDYLFDMPATAPGSLDVYQTGDRYWNATLDGQQGGSATTIDVFRPGSQNWDFALTYTSFALYGTSDGEIGAVAFGIPTTASAMPVTGSATYNAFVAAQDENHIGIRGSATLQFDFGAGTLAGQFDPVIYDLLAGNTSLGHYDFVNTVYGVGSTSFSGQLSSSSVTGLGSFEGEFTGPEAQELMARFSAPFFDPYSGKQMNMFGVWVGAK